MLEAVAAGRDSYFPWLPWVRTDNRSLEECVYSIIRFQKIRESASPVPDNFPIAIFDRATHQAIGGTGLHRIHHASHTAEIGYFIRPERRRQGLCAEAVAGLISWAFMPQPHGWGLRRLEIFCAGRNESSQHVPTRLGLRKEVVQKQHRWIEGLGWDDTLGWGITSNEWDIDARSIKRV